MGFSPYFGSGLLNAAVRHKTFVSYYHKADQAYRNAFEKAFGHLFISKSVQPGDISTDVSTDYIKRLILEGYITDASVLVVLVGSKTWCRKHVDWEISAGLNKKVGGYSGLLDILLPTFPLQPGDRYNYDDLPARLADNAKSGYAGIYTWNWITSSQHLMHESVVPPRSKTAGLSSEEIFAIDEPIYFYSHYRERPASRDRVGCGCPFA